jgi:DNA-binding FadR family transcriptional regulator
MKNKSKETFICFHGDLCAIIDAKDREKARKIFERSLKEYKKNHESKVVN